MSDTIAPYVSHSPEAEAASLPSETPTAYKTNLDRQIAHTENDIAAANGKELPHPNIPSEARLHSDELDRQMSDIWDKAQKIEGLPMPTQLAETADDPVRAAYEWTQETSDDAKRLDIKAVKHIEQQKAEAKKYGLTLEEYQLSMQALRANETQAGPEWREASEGLRSLYPDQEPHETAKWLADVARYARQDGPGAVRWIAQQLGVNPSALSAVTPDAAVKTTIGRFMEAYPEAQEFNAEIAEAISDGKIERGANHLETLQRAYDFVRQSKQTKKPKREAARKRDLDAEMEAVWNKHASAA